MNTQIVTGKMPYDGKDKLEVAIGVRDHGLTLDIPRNSPKILAKIMERCWKYDPAERPTFRNLRNVGTQLIRSFLNHNHDFNLTSHPIALINMCAAGAFAIWFFPRQDIFETMSIKDIIKASLARFIPKHIWPQLPMTLLSDISQGDELVASYLDREYAICGVCPPSRNTLVLCLERGLREELRTTFLRAMILNATWDELCELLRSREADLARLSQKSVRGQSR